MAGEGISSAAVVVETSAVRKREVVRLEDIRNGGRVMEIQARRELQNTMREQQVDVPTEGVTVRWVLEVDGTGFPRPQFLADLWADVERELGERRDAVRAWAESTGRPEHEASVMEAGVEPDPELQRIAQEAEDRWTSAIRLAVQEGGRPLLYSPPDGPRAWTQ